MKIDLGQKVMHVVSGALPNPGWDGLLMGLRPSSALRPLLWELPGGKVEASDPNPQSALARELKEELGLVVSVGERIATAAIYADVVVLVELFEVSVVRPISGSWPVSSPISNSHQETRWVDPDQAVRNLGCSPAFYGHYPFLSMWWERKSWRA